MIEGDRVTFHFSSGSVVTGEILSVSAYGTFVLQTYFEDKKDKKVYVHNFEYAVCK